MNNEFESFKNKLVNQTIVDIELKKDGDACEDYEILTFKLANGVELTVKSQDYQASWSYFVFDSEENII